VLKGKPPAPLAAMAAAANPARHEMEPVVNCLGRSGSLSHNRVEARIMDFHK
jgi:hypothetical protein